MPSCSFRGTTTCHQPQLIAPNIFPDGERFLMVKNAPDPTSTADIILVQNWFQELERLVSTENYH